MYPSNSAVNPGVKNIPTHVAVADLKSERKTGFETLGTETRHRRGERIFSEGESADQIFILREGRIKVSVTSREGRTIILRLAESGQILGLSAALLGSEYEASAEAMEPCRVISIPVREFKRFLAQHPEASMEATRWALKEYRILFNDVCRLALPSTVAGRLASLLDWLKGRHESGRANPRLIVALTHEEIADMTGTSRETVSRTLQQFQRENVISIKGASLTVLRPEALEQLAV
jgi:CRP/FNR family transcriptional regulator, cyclic AMP receptor protein